MKTGKSCKMEKNGNNRDQAAKLVNITVPKAVFKEVENNFRYFYPEAEFTIVRSVFYDFEDLFEGRYPGYQKCNTPYHDMTHTVDTALLFSRIADGYNVGKKPLSSHIMRIGIIAVLFHDSGYIQKMTDTAGTGAKHTLVHEKKSVEFIRGYFKKIGLTRGDFNMARNMIRCTDLKITVSEIDFGSDEEMITGFIVGTADLVSQMSERAYLERLSLLYREFKEGNIQAYESEHDLLKKTVDFYKHIVRDRLDKDFQKLYKYAQVHFKERYHIDSNLYMDAIRRQFEYLSNMKDYSIDELKSRLRRKATNE
ncbi:MAG: hypothetical protein ABIH89_00495 [Elusimicrobiota bacterium]